MNHRVLVAVDDTTESLRAAATAARLCVDLHAEVRVLTVIEDNIVDEELDRATGPHALERRRQAATNLLEFVRRRICAEGVEPSRVEVKQAIGEPFHVILDEARSWPADMIVMAVSDERRIRSNYVGSVTEQVIEFSACAVLVVPAASERYVNESSRPPSPGNN
jgi:nucleotide-binding universal stress UspA family protein